jgi:hypothetical protein
MARNVSLGQLRADVQNQADIAGATVRNVATLLNRYINQSIQRFRERLSTEGAQHFLVSSTKSVTAGATSPYPFKELDLTSESPSVVRVFGIDVTLPSGDIRSLIQVPFTQRDNYGGPIAKGAPDAWANYQTAKCAIFPPPDTTYSLQVWYLPVLADLASDSDTFNGIAGWEDYITWDVVCRTIVRDQYPQAFQMAMAYRDDYWRDILSSATKVTSAGGAVIGRDTMGRRGLHVTRRTPPAW